MASVTASTTPQTLPEHKGASRKETRAEDASAPVQAEGEASADETSAIIPQKRGSLARRMGFIAAVWIIVLLLGGGIALERTLTRQVEANFDEQLEYQLTSMVASAEIDSFGEVWFYRTLGDQRFLEPNSGLYWQISGEGYDPYPSRSLWDRTLDLRGGEAGDDHFDSEVHFYDSSQFSGEPLRIAERTVILPGSETRWTFAVASATEEMDYQIQSVRSILIWSFAVLGLGLLVMALLQIRYGLSPLRRVRAAIQKLRTRFNSGSETLTPAARATRAYSSSMQANKTVDTGPQLPMPA